MNTFGYGARMDKVTWKKDAYINLYEMVQKDEPLYKEFKEYYEEKRTVSRTNWNALITGWIAFSRMTPL